MTQTRYDRSELPRYGQNPQQVRDAFLQAVQDFETLLGRVPADVPWREGGWTALHIQDHLTRTHLVTVRILKTMESDLPQDRLLHATAAAQQRLMAPREIKKLEAPSMVQPQAHLERAKVQQNWREGNAKFVQQLEKSHLTGNRTFPHIYIGELSALEWAQFMPYHIRHHMQQLQALQPMGV